MASKMKFAGKHCGRGCEYLQEEYNECGWYRKSNGMPKLVAYETGKGWLRLPECVADFGNPDATGTWSRLVNKERSK